MPYMFEDRSSAGRELAEQLAEHKGEDAVVVALPRGGVVVGYEIAQKLDLPLDILAVRKIGHPSSAEYAIGAVDDTNNMLMSEHEVARVDQEWLDQEVQKERAEAKRRAKTYRGNNPRVPLTGKTVIVADDGIATGLTMRLAVRAIRAQDPKRIIVAAPVVSREAVSMLRSLAEEVVYLLDPAEFRGAIGAHYIDFEQVGDDEVIRLMHTQTIV